MPTSSKNFSSSKTKPTITEESIGFQKPSIKKKILGPKIAKDPTRKIACQLHPKTFSSSKMKQTSCEFPLEKCLVKLFRSGVAR
jgi:hypothetical protein